MWRYAPLLPVPADIASRKNLAPGMTKLVKADNLAAALGMQTLWVKDDSGNPTHSFKDRVVAIALSAAQELGFTTVGCASTGNLAGAVAAAAARAGLKLVRHRPERPRGGQARHDRRLRRHPRRRRRQLRRREPALLGGRRRPRLGLRQREPAARTTPRARRPSATRSPSSSAGGCRVSWSRRSRPGR